MPVAQMGGSLQLDTQLRDVLAIFILSYWGLTVQQESLLLGGIANTDTRISLSKWFLGFYTSSSPTPKEPTPSGYWQFQCTVFNQNVRDPAPPPNLDCVFMDGFCYSAQHSSHYGLDIRVLPTLLATEGAVTRGPSGRAFISQLRQVWPDDLTLLCYQKLEHK